MTKCVACFLKIDWTPISDCNGHSDQWHRHGAVNGYIPKPEFHKSSNLHDSDCDIALNVNLL